MTTCPLCQSTVTPDANTCATCQAQRGYRDGNGTIRSRNSFVALGITSAMLGVALIWLAIKIQFWLYYYPLMTLGAVFLIGTVIIAIMLVRGPKWYPHDPKQR